ncbi:hypothetical protein MMF93_31250 [Streptomyces tubbatahanensis]|uniref:Uncharacterized protein n=1 Tax=Streptomyces tubbatahanensis TaxID=2923272 RepID=A0ABY3Y1E1_9ACTN|nr:hypothetical protein [Streptomyces tubbatahanensis]UNT00449.1 hypothetical protein MMF93_31250 [Streptomyces tubbatahanensis]
MDLRGALLRATAARPHVLLVTTPGGTAVRLAVERHLRRLDVPSADAPADADVLLVAGPDCPCLEPAFDRLWQDMPEPRCRARVRGAEAVPEVVDDCRAMLASAAGQRGTAGPVQAGRPSAELPMAQVGSDRDGLTLDRLHVPLGPLLSDWPTGLTLRLTLQGDVVEQARVEGLPPPAAAPSPPFWAEPWLRAEAGERVTVGAAARRRAAAHLDSLARLLSVAGWQAAATTARRLRDELLTGVDAAAVRPRVERFARRVGRSRVLYWLTRGIGELTEAEAQRAAERAATGTAETGLGPAVGQVRGDVPARYRAWLASTVHATSLLEDATPLGTDGVGPRGWVRDGLRPSAALVGVLPQLLRGAELAAARLIVASLDPDPDELATAAPRARVHG